MTFPEEFNTLLRQETKLPRKFVRNLILMLLVVPVMATVLSAQVIMTSTIVGTVTDPQGAVVPGARVTLRNVDTGVEWNATTDPYGIYQFRNLNLGHYEVMVDQAGFAHAVSTAVNLEAGATQRVDFRLKIGGTTQKVTVSAAAALLKTDEANISDTIQGELLRDLPIQGRQISMANKTDLLAAISTVLDID